MDKINKQKIKSDNTPFRFINLRLKKNSKNNIIKNYIYINEFKIILDKT